MSAERDRARAAEIARALRDDPTGALNRLTVLVLAALGAGFLAGAATVALVVTR